MDEMNENVIEWLKDDDTATVTLCQRRMITKMRKLADSHPEECKIIRENRDGSIVVHVPVKWVKILPIRVTSEEQREKARQNMQKYNSKRNSQSYN